MKACHTTSGRAYLMGRRQACVSSSERRQDRALSHGCLFHSSHYLYLFAYPANYGSNKAYMKRDVKSYYFTLGFRRPTFALATDWLDW